MRVRRIGNMKIIALVAVAVVVVAFLAYQFSGVNQQQTKQQIKVGYLSVTPCLPLFVAVENGYFAEEGFDVELINFQSSNQVGEAAVNEQIDLGLLSTSVVFNIEQRSPESLKIIADFTSPSERPFNSIIVRRESNLTVSDLKGKRIALFPGSTALALTNIAMKDLLGDDFTAEYVQIIPTLWLQSLESGQVDAIISYEPFTTLGVENGVAKVIYPAIFEKHVLEDIPQGSFVVSSKLAKGDKETVRKMQKALSKSLLFIRENEAEARSIATKYVPIDENVAQKFMLHDWQVSDDMDLVNLQRYADLLLEKGELTQKMDVTNLVFTNG